jgi:hypothetical protein
VVLQYLVVLLFAKKSLLHTSQVFKCFLLLTIESIIADANEFGFNLID